MSIHGVVYFPLPSTDLTVVQKIQGLRKQLKLGNLAKAKTPRRAYLRKRAANFLRMNRRINAKIGNSHGYASGRTWRIM